MLVDKLYNFDSLSEPRSKNKWFLGEKYKYLDKKVGFLFSVGKICGIRGGLI